MAADIVAYFDWRREQPEEVVLTSLERALLDCVPLLEPMGLLGDVGTSDVWTVDTDSEGHPPDALVVHRLDIPEMRMMLSPGCSAMDLSLLWGFYAANNERKTELSVLVLKMAAHLPVTEAFIAPHGLETFANQAFEQACQGREFVAVKEYLLVSKYAWGFKRSSSNAWTMQGKA